MSTNAGFQLFPAPSTAVSPKRNGKSGTNPSRRPSTRRHGSQPQSPPQSAVERSQSPILPVPDNQDGFQQYTTSGRFSPPPHTGHDRTGIQQQHSQATPAELSRSQSPTLMRNTSNASHPHSQAHYRPQSPLAQINTSRSPPSSPPRQIVNEVPVIRSIFPTYNPDIRLEHQDYYPTVYANDDRVREIPRAVLSKRPYSPSISDQSMPTLPSMRNQLQRNPSLGGTMRGSSPTQSPGPSRNIYPNSIASPINSPPLRQGPTPFQTATMGNGGGNRSPSMEEVSSTKELKELWKVTNGWRVSPSEGRTFVLQMTSDPEEPIHTLSSTTDPFYTLRIEPTSTSAHLTMHRHDPSKAPTQTTSPTSKIKSGLGLGLNLSSSSSSSSTVPPTAASAGKLSLKKGKADDTIEVLTTTLEEVHRRLPPNDGLVALLYPTAASNLVIHHQNTHPNTPSTTIRSTAERECARLIWDEDSQHYYLCHPCLSQPFIIRITKSPAWSKVEYVLEHPELPNDLVRLVRGVGGVGGSWCVVDSGTAGGLEGVFVVDVAVTAVCVVAVAEEQKENKMGCGERFEGPPTPQIPIPSPSPRSSKFFAMGMAKSKSKSKSKKKNKDRDSTGLNEMEIDIGLELESQESFKAVKKGKKGKDKEDRLPCALRCLVWGFKCVIWVVGAAFGCAVAVVIGISECLARKKK